MTEITTAFALAIVSAHDPDVQINIESLCLGQSHWTQRFASPRGTTAIRQRPSLPETHPGPICHLLARCLIAYIHQTGNRPSDHDH